MPSRPIEAQRPQGINCIGSSACPHRNCPYPSVESLNNILKEAWKSHNLREYASGERIACLKCRPETELGIKGHPGQPGVCVFAQGLPSSVNLKFTRAQQLVQGLVNFGCETCGSVPVYPENDVSTGMLTINYVAFTTCEGMCS